MYCSEEGVLYSTDRSFSYFESSALLFYPKAKTDKHFTVKAGTTGIRGFNDNPYLQLVTIPETVTKIGQLAFGGSAITKITLPAHVEIIDKYAFSDCKQLKSVILNEGLREIKVEAFSEYKGEDIHLPYTVTIVEENAFVNSTAKIFDADGNDITGLLNEPGNHYIESTVEQAPAIITLPDITHALQDGKEVSITGLTNIVIQGNGEIPENAFANNKYLKSITIGDEVSGIGKKAFERCENLKNIKLGKSIQIIHESAFDRCHRLRSLLIPDSVKVIEDHAFETCFRMTSIDFGKGIEEIDYCAFCGCRSLVELKCTSQIKRVGYRVFEGTPWYENNNDEFLILGGCLIKHTYKDYKENPNITIPNTVISVAQNVLGIASVKTLTIPGSIKRIESRSFNYALVENVIIQEGVEELGDVLLIQES